ncbi:NAD-dependent epimerase/dehydratase family protein [Akkermansia sp. N21169]|uniref:SDR family oxidoreductase n=1 Tax=Akkermansia sp. N21169 TaxID=3040765 RepID=UPI00244E8149|nr:NAD-dependent epimerase/dehydratase family protein [Akkermansia sp. N21169]MDH3069435.1 NAD-dependent epimerase/dehydratase family protein [Akkermansia sp. N21169]
MKAKALAITGVLGYSGRYMAGEARERGYRVLGLTNSRYRSNPGNIRLAPLSWDDPARLAASLQGCDVLLNTYWVRFNHRKFSHEQAVAHTKILFHAAREADVKRIVHVSITNPDPQSGLSYFRGKAQLEEELASLGVPFSILRPAVLFGEQEGEDILLNNMAWVLRHFPLVLVFGKGDYEVRPIHVRDLAQLAVREAGRNDTENLVIDAVGPDSLTFRGLFEELGHAIGASRPVIGTPYWAVPLVHAATTLLGFLHGDVMLTRDEIRGLTENRLASSAPASGTTSLRAWIREHGASLGLAYSSELARR